MTKLQGAAYVFREGLAFAERTVIWDPRFWHQGDVAIIQVALEGEARNITCNIIVPGALARIAEEIDTIRDATDPLIFPVVPHAHSDHIKFSFEMAAKG